MLHSCMSFLGSISESAALLSLLFLVTQLLVFPVLMCVFQATRNNYIDDVAANVLAGL